MTTPNPDPRAPARAVPLAVAALGCLGIAGGIGGLQFVGMGYRVPAILGTVSSWISAGGIVSILALLLWAQMGNRRIGVDERVAMNADKKDVRDHYADEVTTLRARLDEASARYTEVVTELEARHANSVLEIEGKYRRLLQETESHYKALLRETEHEHEECKRDRDALRSDVGKMREEVEGLRAQIRTQATDRVIALGKPGAHPPSENVVASAHRVRGLGRRTRGADKGPGS